MAQEMFKGIAHLIAFAIQLDAQNNAPKIQMVVYQEMEMGHKEIVMVTHFVTPMMFVLQYVQWMGLRQVTVMEPKAIAKLDNFVTPTVYALIFVRKIQPKALEMEAKEIAILVNFVTPTVHVLIYAQKVEYMAMVMEVKVIAMLVNSATQIWHALHSAQKVKLMDLPGMVQAIFKEIAHLIKYATPADVRNNAQNFQLMAHQEVEMEHKEIVKLVCFATLAWLVLHSAQNQQLVALREMVQETIKETVHLMKYATQLDVQNNVQKIQLMVCLETEMDNRETAKLVNFVTPTWHVPPNAQRLQLMVILGMAPEKPGEIVRLMNSVFPMECV
jgi:hypothetical protein